MSPQLSAWIQGPVRSWVVSQAYALWSIIVFAVGLGFTQRQITDFPSLAVYLKAAIFPLFMAMVFGIGPFVRAKQGADRLANTVPLASGGSAILQPNVAPPSPQTATTVATVTTPPPPEPPAKP